MDQSAAPCDHSLPSYSNCTVVSKQNITLFASDSVGISSFSSDDQQVSQTQVNNKLLSLSHRHSRWWWSNILLVRICMGWEWLGTSKSSFCNSKIGVSVNSCLKKWPAQTAQTLVETALFPITSKNFDTSIHHWSSKIISKNVVPVLSSLVDGDRPFSMSSTALALVLRFLAMAAYNASLYHAGSPKTTSSMDEHKHFWVWENMSSRNASTISFLLRLAIINLSGNNNSPILPSLSVCATSTSITSSLGKSFLPVATCLRTFPYCKGFCNTTSSMVDHDRFCVQVNVFSSSVSAMSFSEHLKLFSAKTSMTQHPCHGHVVTCLLPFLPTALIFFPLVSSCLFDGITKSIWVLQHNFFQERLRTPLGMWKHVFWKCVHNVFLAYSSQCQLQWWSSLIKDLSALPMKPVCLISFCISCNCVCLFSQQPA